MHYRISSKSEQDEAYRNEHSFLLTKDIQPLFLQMFMSQFASCIMSSYRAPKIA